MRIKSKCTSETTEHNHQDNFTTILYGMGYDQQTIQSTQHPTIQPQNNRNSNNIKWHYLKFPYINEKVNRQMKQIIRNSGLHIRLSQKSNSITNLLGPKRMPITPDPRCNLRQCPLNNNLCNIKNTI